jgi:hypothetical protein
MTRLGVTLLALVFVLAAPAAGGTATTALTGTVGPGFTITLHDAGGAAVTHLDPGEYTIQVDDEATIHNFHLYGPGVDKATDITGTGTETWDVTFTDGTYNFVCDAHAATMNGKFTVGAVTTPPPPPQRLAASVGPGKKIVFARSAKAGKAVITVRDRSTKDNFHLTGPGVNKKTSLRFTGTVTWTVTLRAGTYSFRSDASARLKGTTRVSS